LFKHSTYKVSLEIMLEIIWLMIEPRVVLEIRLSGAGVPSSLEIARKRGGALMSSSPSLSMELLRGSLLWL
jgi:hypothetical protein